MEGLLSYLLFGGLFFLLMRYGCGAHMMHGRSHPHDSENKNTGEKKHIDPVCGMEVDVKQGYGFMYKNELYRFCSKKCLDQFELEPDSYITSHEHNTGGVS